MKGTIISIILFGILICPAISLGQSQTYIAHYIEESHIKNDTLIDKATHVKFILDKSRTLITAFDTNGKQLWKTDPAKDNKLEEYRVKKPTIVYFEFSTNRLDGKGVIAISYNNSQ